MFPIFMKTHRTYDGKLHSAYLSTLVIDKILKETKIQIRSIIRSVNKREIKELKKII